MNTILTVEQQHRVLKKALEFLQNYHGALQNKEYNATYHQGLCGICYHILRELYPKISLGYIRFSSIHGYSGFSSIYALMPEFTKNSPDRRGSYWWAWDDYEARVNYLQKCIEETAPKNQEL